MTSQQQGWRDIASATCEGCGTSLKDGGVDWYCPNDACSFESDRAKAWLKQWQEEREHAEYERLKAKFDPPCSPSPRTGESDDS
jgi:hypothetical protein